MASCKRQPGALACLIGPRSWEGMAPFRDQSQARAQTRKWALVFGQGGRTGTSGRDRRPQG